MKNKMLMFCLFGLFGTLLVAEEQGFYLGHWKIDVDSYMAEYDKKMKSSDQKDLKIKKMLRSTTLVSLSNTVIEIKDNQIITNQPNKTKIVDGKTEKTDSNKYQFYYTTKESKDRQISLSNLGKDSILYQTEKGASYILLKISKEDAEKKIKEFNEVHKK